MTTRYTTYKDAGVDIAKADALIEDIKEIAKRTYRPGVIAGVGGFGAAFEIPSHYKQPMLVSGTDGVGTKLKLAIDLNKHDTIGIDLVAMCVNDVICLGAEPLFFLDYYATGKLNTEHAKHIIQGIGSGCELAGCALIGGETAEMPGLYQHGDYDLAGFCVGVVEKSKLINSAKVNVGDQLIALASNGPHSNGYSLIRYVIDKHHIDLSILLDHKPLSAQLLKPTRIYAKSIRSLLQSVDVHGIAHITGGGLIDNIPRILPDHVKAVIQESSWEWPIIFQWLQETGNIHHDEMIRSFNVGIGMVIAVNPRDVESSLELLTQGGEVAWRLGEVVAHTQETPLVVFA